MADVYSIFSICTGGERCTTYQEPIRFLSKHSRLKYLINLIGPLKYEIPIWPSIEDAVLYAVIGQMLSVSAACSIIKQLLNNFGTSSEIIVWAESNADVSGPIQGVSQRKRKALREWSLYWKASGQNSKTWTVIPISEYHREITNIWGFGRWSADIIAIFHLGRLDVWPETDGGIKKAAKVVFGTDRYDSIKKHINGYESVAAVYLWEMINRKLISEFTNSVHHG